MTWTYIMVGEIDDSRAGDFIAEAYRQDLLHPSNDWRIIIHSGGGDAESASAIYDTLRAFSIRGGGKHHITTIIRGKAYSGAAVIAQAGDHRVAGCLSLWMFHETSPSLAGSLVNIQTDVELYRGWNRKVAEIFAERSAIACDALLEMIAAGDWSMGSDYLLQYQLIDEIDGDPS